MSAEAKPTDKPSQGNNEKEKIAVMEQELEDRIEEVGRVPPPDGGFGWVVVIASFLVNMAVDGIIYTAGKVLIPVWEVKFGSTPRAGVALSLLTGCYYLCGPLASAFVNVFGIRSVAIGGSLLATTSFLLASQFGEDWQIYLLFGVCGGIGFGFMYLPSIVILSTYFSKKRSIATGIAVCGSGIGTLVFAQLASPVFDLVGGNVSLFMICLAALSISGAIFSMFFAPLTASDAQVAKAASIVKKYEGNGSSEATRELLEAVRNDLEELNRPGHNDDVFYTGNAPVNRSRSNTMEKKDAEAHRASSHVVHVTEQHTVEHIVKKGKLELIKESLMSICDKDLLLSPSFMTLAVSGTFTVLAFLVPFNYLSEAMKEKGTFTEQERAMPLTLIGFFNVAARIVCGLVANHPKLSALQVSNIATIIAGTSMMFVPFCTELWHFYVFTVPFSAGVACFAALRSVICVELIGVEKLSNAFGILMVFMGIGAVLGGPIAGAIKTFTGNYDISFYVMGAVFSFSGIMTIRLQQLKDWEEARRRVRVGTEMRVIGQS